MPDEPSEAAEGKPSEFLTAGEIAPEEVPSPQRGGNTFAAATNRHLADLIAQRNRLEIRCADYERKLGEAATRIESLATDNARLNAAEAHYRGELESERLQRGFVGIIATILAAIGGGFVSVWGDWRRWLFASILIIGCSYMIYNSIVNLSSEVRDFGIIGVAKRLLRGRDQSSR
jgi:hypothetical protein